MEKTANATERKYAEFKHSFTDAWENTEVQLSYRFAKPTKLEVKRMQDTVTKDSTQAARNLLLSTAHPDDKERLLADMDNYPGIVASFSGALMKGVGVTSELGN